MGLRVKYSKKDYKHELDATHAKSIKSNKVMWPKRREILIGASKRTGRLGVAPHGVTVQPRLTATSLILVPSVQPRITFLSEIPINPATLFIWPDFYAPMVAVVTGSHILFLRGPVCRSAGLFVCLFVCLSVLVSACLQVCRGPRSV